MIQVGSFKQQFCTVAYRSRTSNENSERISAEKVKLKDSHVSERYRDYFKIPRTRDYSGLKIDSIIGERQTLER